MRDAEGHQPRQGSLDARVASVAGEQFGLFTRDQARKLGATPTMIRHRVSRGRWERLSPTVLRIAGTPRTWHQRTLAACLAWGPDAVVSHRAAARLWLPDLDQSRCLDVTVPRHRSRQRVADEIVHRNRLDALDRAQVGPIPVTTTARTLIDLASVIPADQVEEALDEAIRRRLVTLPLLQRRLVALAEMRRPGIAVMRRLVEARHGPGISESVFETRLLRVIARARLPKPVQQYEVRDGTRLVARVDLAYPDRLLAIEADGYRWHGSRTAWERDRARDDRLMLLGWRVIHVTWRGLQARPHEVVARIARALRQPTRPLL